MVCPYNCTVDFGQLNDGSCNDFIQNYYVAVDGFYFPVLLIITLAIIVMGRIFKSFLRKRLIIRDYSFKDLEKILDSQDKINEFFPF